MISIFDDLLMIKKLYLDRDGVINKHIPYVGTLERFKWHYEIIPITKLFSDKGYKIIIVTNQSGIERGYYSLLDFFELSYYMIKEFEKNNIEIEVRACPHLPEKNSYYRKPNIGMVNDKRDEKDVLIGDQEIDMLTAKRGKIKNRWLISKDFNSKLATMIYKSHMKLLMDLEREKTLYDP